MNFIYRYRNAILLLIPFISLLLHLRILNLDLIGIHVWRQTQTQTVIDNFYKDDFNILNPKLNNKADTDRILRMEFPLMQWIFALFYKLLGDHIIISRLLTFIIGLFSVWGIYKLANNIFRNKAVATIAAWTFNFSPVFYYYTVNPLPDNFALCCGIWSAAFFFRYTMNNGSFRHLLGSAIFLSLATLTKLPFILYGAFAFGYMIVLLRKEGAQSLKEIIRIILTYAVALIPAFAWYIIVIPTWEGNGIVRGMLDSQTGISGITRILGGTLLSLLPELLINYASVLFFLAGFYFIFRNRVPKKTFFPLFICWSIAITLYYLFEINMIELVHDYYLFPFLPLIFLIVTYGAYHIINSRISAARIVGFIALAILPLTAFLRADMRWNPQSPGFNDVYYRQKEIIRKMIPADALCIVGNDSSPSILLYYIDRKGWTFFDNDLPAEKLDYYRTKGARYIFTDSRIDETPDIRQRLGTKIFEDHDVRVYQLK